LHIISEKKREVQSGAHQKPERQERKSRMQTIEKQYNWLAANKVREIGRTEVHNARSSRSRKSEELTIKVAENADPGWGKNPKTNPMKEEGDNLPPSDHKTTDAIEAVR
jgi:hypothetical protein